MALQLDMDASGEERRETLQDLAGGIEPAEEERARDRALAAAGQDVEPLRVRGDLLPGRARLSLRLSACGGSQQSAEGLVAGAALGEERQAGRDGASRRWRRDDSEGTRAGKRGPGSERDFSPDE